MPVGRQDGVADMTVRRGLAIGYIAVRRAAALENASRLPANDPVRHGARAGLPEKIPKNDG